MGKILYPHLCLFRYVLHGGTEQLNADRYYPPEVLDGYKIDGEFESKPWTDTNTYRIVFAVDDPHNPQETQCFESLKAKTLAAVAEQNLDTYPASNQLGRTWMILGSVPQFGADVEAIAQAAYESLNFSAWIPQKPQKFMGANVFEIWHPPANWKDYGTANSHTLIVLYPNEDKLESIGNWYDTLLMLLLYRSKVLWAYSNIRQIKPTLQQHFFPADTITSLVQLKPTNSIESEEIDLKQAKKELIHNSAFLSHYATCLSFLEVQRDTLQTNLHNYQVRLEQIIGDARKAGGKTNADFLKAFSELATQKYLTQVNADISSLTPGLRVHEKITDTIRGLVELEQAERDRAIESRNRQFQNWVAILGVGLGSASLAGSAISPFVEKILQPSTSQPNSASPPPGPWLSFGFILGFSLVAGITFSILTAIILRLYTELGKLCRENKKSR